LLPSNISAAASPAHCPVREDKAAVNSWRAKLTGTDNPASPRALDRPDGNTDRPSTVTTHGGREQLEFLPGSVKTPFGAAPFPQP